MMPSKQKKNFCICGYLEGNLDTAGYFMVSQKNCYYGSSASERSMFDKPLFHVIMWEAILHAREQGIIQFETGVQYNIVENRNQPSMKEQDIAKFKKGFGGDEKVYLDGTYNLNKQN